jgi:heptosyltransferase II
VRPSLADPDFQPRRVILRTPNPLGDAVMAEPAMRAIAGRFPDAEIVVAAPRAIAALAETWSFAGQCAPIERGGARNFLATARKLRGGDLCVLFPNSFGSAAEVLLAGIPRRLGYDRDKRGWLLTDRVAPPAEPRGQHMIAYYWRLAEALGVAPLENDAWQALPGAERTRPNMRASVAMRQAASEMLARSGVDARPYIVLAPGAGYGSAKQWPAAHYAVLARRAAELDAAIVLVGAPGEVQLCAGIARGSGAVNLAGQTDLGALIGIIAGAAAFVGNDAGAAHLAAALGAPGVVLFGSTSEAHSAPIGAAMRIMHLHLECSPCFARECPLGHLRCLTEIAPDAVLEPLRAALDQGGKVNSVTVRY